MQKQYYLYDENGFYIEPAIVDINETITGDAESEHNPIPDNATDIRPPDGLYKAQFNPQTQTWSEAATQEEIYQILHQNETQLPSVEDRLNALEAMRIADLLGGGSND